MALPLTYNARHLLARRLSSGLTFLIVAVVVFVLALLLSFVAGIRAALGATGSPRNIIVLKPGATAESTSLIPLDDLGPLIQTPGLAAAEPVTGTSAAAELFTTGRLRPGDPLLSPELAVQTMLPRRTGGAPANVAIRGVDDIAFAVHAEVRLVAGRLFTPGAPEVLVGTAAQERFAGLELGATVALGRKGERPYQVVGVFSAGGGALESELWAPRTMIADSFHRRLASSVCLQVRDAAAVAPAVAYIQGPAVGLEARPELQYYRDLAEKTREIVVLTSVLVGIMAIGAAFAVATTMYAAVDGRRRELAMLRALGFGRGAIMAALLAESLLLCLLASACGLLVSAAFSGRQQDFLSDTTWTVLAYELKITPGIVATALLVATAVSVGGTLAPALRAARLNVITALRKA